MVPFSALILLGFILTLDGLTALPNKLQTGIPCENCTSTVGPHNSSEISTESSRWTTIKPLTDSPTILVVLEEDSSSDSMEKIIIGELIEGGSNVNLSIPEEVINPEKIRSVTLIE